MSKIDRPSIQSGQTANYSSCYKIYIYVSQLFISRMPEMRAIPQLPRMIADNGRNLGRVGISSFHLK